MNYDQCLKILQVNQYSSIEEIKSNYRKLAKVYHPDLNKNMDGKLFHLLNDAYDWLIKNHKPHMKPKNMDGYTKLYRVLQNKKDQTITIPYKNNNVLKEKVVINCIFHIKEFRIFLEENEYIPKRIVITNVFNEPIYLNILGENNPIYNE